MRKLFSTLSLLLLLQVGHAQDSSARPAFSSLNQAGLLEGSAGRALLLQTVNGLRYGPWFAGVGTGLDYYTMRSVPLFLELRRQLGSGRNQPFVYAGGGLHFPWEEKNKPLFFNRADYHSGLYYDAGAGFQIGLDPQRNSALLISLGYSFKAFSADEYVWMPCINPPCPEEKRQYTYDLRRFAIKAGWRFH